MTGLRGGEECECEVYRPWDAREGRASAVHIAESSEELMSEKGDSDLPEQLGLVER